MILSKTELRNILDPPYDPARDDWRTIRTLPYQARAAIYCHDTELRAALAAAEGRADELRAERDKAATILARTEADRRALLARLTRAVTPGSIPTDGDDATKPWWYEYRDEIPWAVPDATDLKAGWSAQCSAATPAALDHLRRQGKRISGKIPFGYQADESGQLVPVAEEQATIALICRLRGDGASFRRIADELQRLEVRTKSGGRLWTPATIRGVFLREQNLRGAS